MLSGVSLTNEKSYLVGKFARLALHTANLDYNGRYCMVSAGVGNKKALGIDRAPNPWSDIPLADVVWVAGSNVAETFPITTSYIWRARDRGAKLIVQDPRVVPLARTADLFLPVRPGSDSALFGAVLHELIRNDWLDHEFIDAHTVDFDQAAAAAADMTPAWAAEITGVPAARIEEAAELWGTAATGMMLHARGIEQQTKGVDNVLAAINLGLATGKFGKPGCGVSTITGQGNGQGGREHGHKCDQLPGNRDITNPEHREAVAKVWEVDESEIPGKGIPAQEIIEAIHDGTIKGLLSICFNPARVGARQQLHRRGARQARVLLGHRLLPVGVRPARRRGARRARCTRRTRAPPPAARAASSRSTPRSRPPARPGSTGRSCSRSPSASARASTSATRAPTRSSTSSAGRRRAAPPTTRAPPGSASRPSTGCSGPSPRSATPGRLASTRAGGSPTPTARPASTACRTARRPRSSTTSTRCGSPPAGSSASTCRAPRPAASPASSSSTPSRCARSTRSSPSRSASPTATRSPSGPAAARSPCPRPWSTPSGPTPCSSRTTGPGNKAANQLTIRAVDPLSKMPEFKVAAVHVARAAEQPA